jgi:pimeloyl-ACP methyl ester carboxylesterase
MPYAENQGVRVHYQVEGNGPPLLLQHGFMQSVEDWFETGYVDALKGHHQVILVDARGHGRSDKPHDFAAYRLEHRVGDLVAVLDEMGVEKAAFWGYSMGGWIGFGIVEYAAERFDRLVIGGASPYAKSQQSWRDLIGSAIAEGGHGTFIPIFEQMIGTILPSWRARLLNADLKAFLGAGGEDRESHESVLTRIVVPSFIYSGDADPRFAEAKAAADTIQVAMFLSLPGLNHLEGFVRSDLVLPAVAEFLRRSSRRP